MARLKKAELRKKTLRENLEIHAQNTDKKGVKDEVVKVIKEMEGFKTSEGIDLLETPISELDDNPYIAEFVKDSPFSKRLTGKRSGMLTALVRLNAVFNDAGLRDFPNMQARLKQYIGEDWKTISGYKYYRARLTLIGQPGDQYKQIKDVLTSLEGKEKAYLGIKLFSGLRQTDLSNAVITNYDSTTGRLVFTEGKSKQVKEVFLRPGARAFVEMALEGRTSGQLFPNKKTLDTNVNAALKAGVSPSIYEDIDGVKSSDPFTLKDLRNNSETILDESNLSAADKKFVAGRAGVTEQEKYVKTKTKLARIKSALNLADAKVVGYSQTTSLGQYLANVGVPEKYINEDARRVVPSLAILTDDEIIPSLGDDFLDSLPEEGSGSVPRTQSMEIDLNSVQKYQETVPGSLEKRREEITLATLKLREENQRLLDANPDLAKPTEIETSQTTKTPASTKEAPSKYEMSDGEAKDIKQALLNLIDSKTTKAIVGGLPVVGVGIGATTKKAEAEELIEEGRAPFLAYGQKALEFGAEEFTPYGLAVTAKDVGSLVAEETADIAEQTKEQFLSETEQEAQMRELFDEQRRIQP